MRGYLCRLTIICAALAALTLAGSLGHEGGSTSAQTPPPVSPLPPFPDRPAPAARPFDASRLYTIGGALPVAPSRASDSIPLKNSELRREVAAARPTGALTPETGAPQTLTRVEVIHTLPAGEMEDAITALGGIIEGEAEGLVQANVRTDQLVALEHHAGVEYLRPPARVDGSVDAQRAPSAGPLAVPVVGEEVAKTNAAAWQAAGFTGAGVKIGIVDTFGQTPWNAAQAAGEVPAAAGTFCQFNGTPCSSFSCGGPPCTIFTIFPTAQHGTAVTEIIHEMAPGAQVYLAWASTTIDLQAAVNYFASQGVKIISRSQTSEYDGPGDGTGPIANVVNSAVSQGMAWFNAAGNTAGPSPFAGNQGQYWRGAWVDANANGWLDWAPGDEFLGFGCGFMNGLRWNDWGANRTDYDLYIYKSLAPLTLAYTSLNDQTAGAPPIELNQKACDGVNIYYAAVQLHSVGNGTAGDVLEFMTNQGILERWQNPYSASGPVADSASTGELTIGAIDPPLGTTIAPYSSQGPTNDGRTKPDLSAASCVVSFTYTPSCFNGTSAATPAAAGAAALILGVSPTTTPAQLKTYMINSATVDRGAAGVDNIYGAGELVLPNPTVDTDNDGCPDVKEPLLVPPTDPNNPWDFYNVPVPALFSAPDPLTVFHDHAVGAGDAQAVFAYFKKAARVGTVEYEQDLNRNGIKDGIEYDRSYLGSGKTGPPDGNISASDAQLAFAQFKFGYAC